MAAKISPILVFEFGYKFKVGTNPYLPLLRLDRLVAPLYSPVAVAKPYPAILELALLTEF